MENTKPKKSKKDSIEIRFTVSENDGNLKEMMNKVPQGCYTDFTKQALRYYLKAVRDGEVECDFLKPHVLDEFKTALKSQEPSFADVLRLIQACGGVGTVAQTTVPTPIVNTIATQPMVEDIATYSSEEYVEGIGNNGEDNNEDEQIDYKIDITIDEDEDEDGAIKENSMLNHTTFNF